MKPKRLVARIADRLDCSESFVYQLLPTIPGAWKLGTRWKVSEVDIDAYVEQQKAARAKERLKEQAHREQLLRAASRCSSKPLSREVPATSGAERPRIPDVVPRARRRAEAPSSSEAPFFRPIVPGTKARVP
jgi:hypothetical protein